MPASLLFCRFSDGAGRRSGVSSGVLALTPSLEDWRDQWTYFLIVDRFNNRLHAPVHLPFDDPGLAGLPAAKRELVESLLKQLAN